MENAVLGQAWARGTTHAQGTKAAEKKTDPWVSKGYKRGLWDPKFGYSTLGFIKYKSDPKIDRWR